EGRGGTRPRPPGRGAGPAPGPDRRPRQPRTTQAPPLMSGSAAPRSSSAAPSGSAAPASPGAAAPGAVAIAPQRPAAASLQPQDIYQAAYIDFSKGSYSLAIAGFREFLRRYPDHELAGSAQYWIGESYLSLARGFSDSAQSDKATESLEQAVQEFKKVLAKYPRADKVPTAPYKEALALIDLKEPTQAPARLTYLVENLPPDGRTRQGPRTPGRPQNPLAPPPTGSLARKPQSFDRVESSNRALPSAPASQGSTLAGAWCGLGKNRERRRGGAGGGRRP